MNHLLFKSRSPMVGWFLLMELLTVGCIVVYWMESLHGASSFTSVSGATLLTLLFAGSNVLLFRGWRLVGIFGLIVCWTLLAGMLLPIY